MINEANRKKLKVGCTFKYEALEGFIYKIEIQDNGDWVYCYKILNKIEEYIKRFHENSVMACAAEVIKPPGALAEVLYGE